MPLVKAVCTNCGAILDVDNHHEAAICKYCNTPYIVEKAISNYNNNYIISTSVVNIYESENKLFTIRAGILEKYNGSSRKVVIPDGVVKISDKAFLDLPITSIHIPDSVEYIGNRAFALCTKLTEIIIPESVSFIDEGAFIGCVSLKSISIPEKIKKIKPLTFFGCKELESVILPSGLLTIESNAFTNCFKLKTIHCNNLDIDGALPREIYRIESEAFMHCYELNDVHFPDNLTYIGRGAFRKCRKLSMVYLPPKLQEINEETFLGCRSLNSVYIPDAVTSIADNAFDECYNLFSIDYPNEWEDNPIEEKFVDTMWYQLYNREIKKQRENRILQRRQWAATGRCEKCGTKLTFFSRQCKNCKQQ